MPRRKLKPGPKRRVGRPATAAKREAEAKRLKSEREILAQMGLRYVTVVVADEYADFLRDESKVNRIKGLLSHAEQSGDLDKARVLRAKLEIAEAERAQACARRAEDKAERDRLAAADGERLSRVDAAAERLSDASRPVAAPRPGQEHSPPSQRLSEAELRAALRRTQPSAIF